MNLNLKNDIIFKAFFSRKGNEKYLKEFLEALLKIEIERIIIKEEVSLEKLFKIEKGGRLDLLAKLNNDFIELPKFRRIKPDINDKLNQWLLFIDDYDRGLIKMAEDKNETLKEARSVMTYLTGDEEVKRLAELREIWAIDRAFDRKEAKREVAEEMLKNNISIEIIANCTGLTKEEIEKLKE